MTASVVEGAPDVVEYAAGAFDAVVAVPHAVVAVGAAAPVAGRVCMNRGNVICELNTHVQLRLKVRPL